MEVVARSAGDEPQRTLAATAEAKPRHAVPVDQVATTAHLPATYAPLPLPAAVTEGHPPELEAAIVSAEPFAPPAQRWPLARGTFWEKSGTVLVL